MYEKAVDETVHVEAGKWPRWISIDWGFQHPSAVYWHCAMPRTAISYQRPATRNPELGAAAGDENSARIVTYREFVQNGLSPRMLGQAIVERCKEEKIQEIYLSPDAFAHRTSEASIAEQLGVKFWRRTVCRGLHRRMTTGLAGGS